ncbi:unnamed protein product [Amaranthus hypochondriacus]
MGNHPGGCPLHSKEGDRVEVGGSVTSSYPSIPKHGPEDEVAEKGRKWRRRSRSTPEQASNVSSRVVPMGGCKRTNNNDTALYLLDFDNEVHKKRTAPMEVEKEDNVAKVAGPTEWALGGN